MTIYYEIKSTCKGGGYIYARTEPLHPKANSRGLYPLHIILATNSLGRNLTEDEVVHHIDENRNNNDISNLVVLTNSDHAKLHAIKRQVEDIEVSCPVCKTIFYLKPNFYRERIKRSKTGKACCSHKCGAIHATI